MYSVKGGHLETVRGLLKYKSLKCDYQNKVCVCVCVCVCVSEPLQVILEWSGQEVGVVCG